DFSNIIAEDVRFHRELMDALFYDCPEHRIPLQKRNKAKVAYVKEVFLALRCGGSRTDLRLKWSNACRAFNHNVKRRNSSATYVIETPALLSFLEERAAIEEENEEVRGEERDSEENEENAEGPERDYMEPERENNGGFDNLSLSDFGF
ncbi:hypothetical protein PENTCL1PPCAC_7679, partial [Pristionchus entomophagus]